MSFSVFIKKLLLGLAVVLFFSLVVNAQERSLRVLGTAEWNMKPLAHANISLFKQGDLVETIKTSIDGKFHFNLEMNSEYTILVEKQGMLSKKIAFNTEVPGEVFNKWTIEFAMTLFEGCEGVNTSILNEPVDRIQYSTNRNEFISDKVYVEKVRYGMATLISEIERCQSDKYQEALNSGDKLFAAKEYDKAREQYNEALTIVPDDKYALKKVEEINAKIGQNKQLEQNYSTLIKEADQLFAAKNYEAAREKYNKAMLAMPQNVYPQNKIASINQLLKSKIEADQEKQAKEASYNNLVSKANVAFNEKNYELAKSFFEQALQVKPEALLPKDKIAELTPLLAKQQQENQQKSANDKSFNEAMALGQVALQKNDIITARQHFAKAASLNPSSQLPKQKIDEIDKLAEQQKQANLKADKAQIQKQIIEALDQGDINYNQKKYELALAFYQKALALDPNDTYSKQRIEKIKSLILSQDVEKQQALEKSYKDNLAKGDALLATASYQQAVDVYKQALLQKPDDASARIKLADAEQKLAAEKQKQSADQSRRKEYENLIAEGNKLFAAQQFTLSKETYQKALAIYPDQVVPRAKITEIDNLLTQKLRDQQFKEIITRADGFLAAKDLNQAKTSYQQALAINANDPYATGKVTEIDNLIQKNTKLVTEQKVRDEQFATLIKQGDLFMSTGKLAEAKTAYQSALALKAADTYATAQIAKIDASLAEQLRKENENKSKELQFTNAIKQGDQFMSTGKLAEAKTAYQSALALKAADTYATVQIVKIDASLAEQLRKENENKSKELQFTTAIKQGDQFMSTGKLAEAKSAYQSALALKAADTYATAQIAKIDASLAEQLRKENENKSKELQFTTAIKQGDQFMSAGKLAEAKSAYQSALALKAADTYATAQIAKIDASLAEQLRKENENKSKELQFTTAIKQGDQFMSAGKLAEAKTAYQSALALKAADAYSTAQIAKIDASLAEQLRKENENKSKELQFTTAIKQGDQFMSAGKLAEAKTAYQSALSLKAADTYATAQIVKIDASLAEQLRKENENKSKEIQFTTAIKQGDQLMSAGKLAEAKTAYQSALALKAADTYATAQITKIDASLAEQLRKENENKSKELQFTTAIKQGDQLMSTGKLTEAKTAYQSALALKAADTYATAQIAKIDASLAEQLRKENENKSKELQFTTAIKQGDQFMSAGKLAEAKTAYQSALALKAADVYATAQITKIDASLAEQLRKENENKSKELQFTTAIKQGDQFMSAGKLAEAKTAYQSALALKAADTYATAQITKIDASLASKQKENQAKQEVEQKYSGLLTSGDKAFAAKDYESAHKYFQQALDMKPAETVPRDKLNKTIEMERLVALEASRKSNATATSQLQPTKTKSNKALSELKFANDSERDKYLNGLKQEFPQGVTLEVHKEEFKSTNRYVVIRGSDVNEFRMVKFNWGGVEYSQNGIPVTGQFFDLQVKSRDGEFFQKFEY